jgi:hypothetical protein
MLFIGSSINQKNLEILAYCQKNSIKKVFILSPSKFQFACEFENHEQIEYNEIIMYKYFYRLLQEIDNNTLLVVNECMRTQNRYDLTYNCIRNFLNQTKHQLIFQYLPIIQSIEDFMILFDFDTQSRWKREKFDTELLISNSVLVTEKSIELHKIFAPTTNKTKAIYEQEKEKLIKEVRSNVDKDPHIIPRNLHLIGGKEKLAKIENNKKYIGRNNRFKLPNVQTYKENSYEGNYIIFEFCHNFIDFTDFICLSKQDKIEVLATDLKVDEWYFERYQNWLNELKNAYTKIHR